MVKQKEIYLASLDTAVIMTRKSGVKRMSIILKPHKGVRVTMPYWTNFEEGERFLLSKTEWLKKSIVKIQKIESKKKSLTNFNEIETLGRPISIKPQFTDKFKIVYSEEFIVVEYPVELSLETHEIKAKVEMLIKKALVTEAKQILPNLTAQLAQQFQLKYKVVKIGSPRTRWGSCSYTNNINLSYRLVCLPHELCKYVILHELVHTIHKNHSSKFWDALTKIMPSALACNKQLKEYSLI